MSIDSRLFQKLKGPSSNVVTRPPANKYWKAEGLFSGLLGITMSFEAVVAFWNANYANILISLGIGFVFFVLGPLGLWFSGKKIRKERVRKAKEMLIDQVEGMIVNQETISNAKLNIIFNAVEREVEVTLDSDYDLSRLFEDVILRFQRSKHLDPSQKDAYSKLVSELYESLKNKEGSEGTRIIPRPYRAILEDLKKAAGEHYTDEMQKVIQELESKLSRYSPNALLIDRMFRISKEHPIVFGIFSVGYLIFVILLLSGVIR